LVDEALVEYRDDLRVVAVAPVHVFDAEPVGRLRRVAAGQLHRVATTTEIDEVGIAEAVLPGQVGGPAGAVGDERLVTVGYYLQQAAGPHHGGGGELNNLLEPTGTGLLPVEQERHRELRCLAVIAPIGEAAGTVEMG